MQKIRQIFLESLPILLMIGLIPLVKNDFVLTGVYILVIVLSFYIKLLPKELLIFTVGFVLMIFSEILFISTGVEVFLRNSLFGLMPLWLPFLWGYGFVAIKRSVRVLEN